KAAIVSISFYEAFFKVHYTKGFRLTYPLPLPTSVAGIFGSMLGVDREDLKVEFKDLYFGAALKNYDGIIVENETFIQYKGAKVEKGVVRAQVINHPSYLLVMAGGDAKINQYYNFLEGRGLVYLPYGGQNDFFVEDISLMGFSDVVEGVLVGNYAPQDMVERIESKEAVLSILPVMHNYSENPNFYFMLEGTLRLKRPVKTVEKGVNIAVFPLEMFKLVC
ncbi:MAG: CRISPR-associated protein Cas5, partial [Candidatus Bathyarchaeia archaeon]